MTTHAKANIQSRYAFQDIVLLWVSLFLLIYVKGKENLYKIYKAQVWLTNQ